MANTATPSPESISDSEFRGLLERYPACIAEISDAKGGSSKTAPTGLHSAPTASDDPVTAKPGQKTLASLDEYRYGAAIDTFGTGDPDAAGVAMGFDEVKTLVEWKLYVDAFCLSRRHAPGPNLDALARASETRRGRFCDMPPRLSNKRFDISLLNWFPAPDD